MKVTLKRQRLAASDGRFQIGISTLEKYREIYVDIDGFSGATASNQRSFPSKGAFSVDGLGLVWMR